MSIVIKTENLCYDYHPDVDDSIFAIDDINVEIDKGEFVGIIGPTGSGKSTFVQTLNGLIKPTSGNIFIDGEQMHLDKAKLRDFRFKVGLVFQYPEYQLFEETVAKDIAFGPKNMGLDEDEINKRVLNAALSVGLKEKHMDKSPFELSGGQKRRAAIAGVIAMEPEVLILDEPTAGLDPKGRDKILGQIKEYHKQNGRTIILVSHSMEDVAKYCSKILIFNKSKVFAYDTPENIFARGDEVREIGLDIPQVTRVFDSLKDKGYDVSAPVLNVGQGIKQIEKLLDTRKDSNA